MAESDSTPKTQHTPGRRTDDEVRDEHDRLATIYRQHGLSVLIETASDEIVELRRAFLELAEELRALINLLALVDGLQDELIVRKHPAAALIAQAQAMLARTVGR